jgi:hypothetical protein
MFFLLNASDAAPKIATSFAPAVTAASKPFDTMSAQLLYDRSRVYLNIWSQDWIPDSFLTLDSFHNFSIISHL